MDLFDGTLGAFTDTYNKGADRYNKAASKYNQYKSYVDKGQNVWQACHKDVEKTGQTREALAHCMEVSVGEAAELLCVELGPAASLCKDVAGPIGKKVGEILYDIGSWLGLTNAEEEARLHAQQAAAWGKWEQVDSDVHAAYNRAVKSLDLAVTGVLAADAELGLKSTRDDALKSFQLFGLKLIEKDGELAAPNYWWDPCFASVRVDDPESTAIDAQKVVAYEWQKPCTQAMLWYATWQTQLRNVVVSYGIESSLDAANLKKQTKKRTSTTLVLGAGAVGLAWWLAPKGFWSGLLK